MQVVRRRYVSCSSVSAKRLDAFQAKCLRKILHIQHSFYSRIPNATIYARTHQERLSSKLQRQQLKMFGLVAQKPSDDPLRKVIFKPGTCIPKIWETRRYRGRPKLTCATQIHKLALEMAAGSQQHLEQLLASNPDWRRKVNGHI